eukprot:scaffold1697_cov120-Cylindrotheca_fusiformis.AAC.38
MATTDSATLLANMPLELDAAEILKFSQDAGGLTMGKEEIFAEAQLETLLARKAARTKTVLEKKAVRSTRRHDVKNSLAAFLQAHQPGEEANVEDGFDDTSNHHHHSRRSHNIPRDDSWHHSKDTKLKTQELPHADEDYRIASSKAVQSSKGKTKRKKKHTSSRHCGEGGSKTGLQSSEDPENSSAVSYKKTFLQFDPSNPDSLATVNQCEASVVSTDIQQSDGSTIHVRTFVGLPTFEPDHVTKGPQSARSLPVQCSTDCESLGGSTMSLFEESVTHKRRTEHDGKRRIFGRRMSLSFQLNRSTPSLDGHVLLDDDDDDSDED